MTEQSGISEQGSAASSAALAGASRPRIGADRFRALADRLKKPAAPVSAPVSAPAPQLAPVVSAGTPVSPVAAFAPDVVVPDLHITPVVAPEPAFAEPVFAEPHPVEAEAHPVIPDYIPAPETFHDALPEDAEEPLHAAAPAAAELPDPVLEAFKALTQTAAQSEPVAEPAPEPEDTPDFTSLFADPVPEPAPAPAPVFTPAPPAYEPVSHFADTHVVAPVAPPQPISPLARILAAETKPVVPQIVLPEILPPPPPPPPPVMVIEENGEKVTVAPPSMEDVQERMRELASERLHQLDIENVWRQVLATPSLEERAEFLREAAEYTAAMDIALPPAEVPPEHDLSRIEGAAVANAADSSEPAPLVTDFTETEQLETAELARSLLDMMASGASSGLPHERALAADTLLRLLPKLALKPLAMMAQRLAMMDNPPQLLVAKLIRDDRVEVSGPLLEDCMHITDQDLAIVVAEDNPGKRRMVARRRRLSRAISDKLIATHDPSVLLTLVRNANADISHAGFNNLIEQAAKHEELMAPLSTRGDLGAPHAFELFWPAPAQLRRYLLHRFLTDSETLTKILRITLSSQSGEEGKEDLHLPSPGDVMEYLELACRGRSETAAIKLGDALRVDSMAIHRILLDRQGEALVVMLKAAGFPRANVGDLLPALKKGEVPLLDGERDVSELQSMFDTLSLNKARILLTYWDWAVRKSGPYAPIH
ncbi:DUF2336 domain-containing protein [Aestuariivirga sp.]|uniref:DUF2336 domain-containing protein n=1 Tax=Aestuariivirga sp. TaxID=2650926 RepID=UPI0039E39146